MTKKDKIDFTMQVKKRDPKLATDNEMTIWDLDITHMECVGGKITLQEYPLISSTTTGFSCRRCALEMWVEKLDFRTTLTRTAFNNESSTFIGCVRLPGKATLNGGYTKPAYNVKVVQID
jgi:hypothetical protein